LLARAEFENAVKEALRHYTQPDLLAENALLRTRVLTSSKPGAATPQALRALLAATAKALFAGERDQRLYHVLDLTYLNPASKQEAAASRLGLPYSTYRRHLTAGMDRLTEWLWKQELEAQRVETVAEQTTGSSECVERKLTAILAADVADYSQPTELAVPLPDKPSIAVLPFENMSGDLEQEYFADGMAEDIITALSKL
jgi:hypothetical protein